jgi:hypothetical protein
MNTGKTVFSQILDHLPRYEFDKFVKKYGSFGFLVQENSVNIQ